MHTVFVLLCSFVVIHWLISPYQSGLLHWHCGNLTIAPVPAKQPWWIWINTSFEFIMNDYITTTKQSTAKPCAYLLGYTVYYKKGLSSLMIRKNKLQFNTRWPAYLGRYLDSMLQFICLPTKTLGLPFGKWKCMAEWVSVHHTCQSTWLLHYLQNVGQIIYSESWRLYFV